ncbi:hypothetical protein U1Q18_021799 [Sarracenia purpurea var. burkii]
MVLAFGFVDIALHRSSPSEEDDGKEETEREEVQYIEWDDHYNTTSSSEEEDGDGDYMSEIEMHSMFGSSVHVPLSPSACETRCDVLSCAGYLAAIWWLQIVPLQHILSRRRTPRRCAPSPYRTPRRYSPSSSALATTFASLRLESCFTNPKFH